MLASMTALSSQNSSTQTNRHDKKIKTNQLAPKINHEKIGFYGTVGKSHLDLEPKKTKYVSTSPKKDAMCLAQMIYHEARGDIFSVQADENNNEVFIVENYDSFLAHANVVMLRIEHDEFADSVCSVINERGQFSPKLKEKKVKYNQDILNSLYSMSVDFLLMDYRLDNTDSALFFQIKSPKTKKRMSYNNIYYKTKTKSILSHDFFKLEEKKG
jgi:hypothetical protein